MNVSSLEPVALWSQFEKLNAVPRPSKKEERIRQFMVDFGQSLGLETLVDKIGNIYNRVVLFDSRCIHAASEYFGNTKENSRLFQLFFFDLSE